MILRILSDGLPDGRFEGGQETFPGLEMDRGKEDAEWPGSCPNRTIGSGKKSPGLLGLENQEQHRTGRPPILLSRLYSSDGFNRKAH